MDFFLILQPKGMRVVFLNICTIHSCFRKIKKYTKILVNSPTTETTNDKNGCGKFHHNLPTIILKPFSDHLNLNNQIDPEVHQTSLFFWGSLVHTFLPQRPRVICTLFGVFCSLLFLLGGTPKFKFTTRLSTTTLGVLMTSSETSPEGEVMFVRMCLLLKTNSEKFLR